MPVRGEDTLRITPSEQTDLQERASAHGQGEYVPPATEIRDEGDLSAAESLAEGESLIPDLHEYMETGSSPYSRGERRADELFGGAARAGDEEASGESGEETCD